MRCPAFHAQTRARERYGLNLSVDDIRAMEALIVSGKSTLVAKHFAQRAIHLVFCAPAGMCIPVVWDGMFRNIITVLPKESKQLRTAQKAARRAKRVKELDEVLDLPMSEPADVEVHEQAPNNALAEALEKALRSAGLMAPVSVALRSEG